MRSSSGKRTIREDDDEYNHDASSSVLPSPSPPQRRRLDNSDDEDQRVQPPLSSPLRPINTAGKPPEAGIITRVQVENFMCHRKLTVELCRNVNFIHGQNGSGKSAILAAIQICLGAGARRTHRARNLKELVRKESGEGGNAKVRVTLLNRGPDGFQTDVYGDSITVERSISKNGGYNGYRLLDHEGKERSRLKKDLDAMLDQLNIQVENPVAVLDQEEAKKFLTGKPEDKYAFFTKATELERIDRSYANTVDNINDLKTRKESVEQTMHSAIAMVKKLRKEWEQFEALDKMEDVVAETTLDLCWATFRDFDMDVVDQEQILAHALTKMAKREAELTQLETQDDVDDTQARLNATMNDLSVEASGAAEQKRALELELKHAEAPIRSKTTELHSMERHIKTAKDDVEAAQARLEQERARIQMQSEASDAAKRQAELSTTDARLHVLREQELRCRQDTSTFLRKYEELEPHVEQAKSNTSSRHSQYLSVFSKVEELNKSGSNQLAQFGPKCTMVYQRVAALRDKWKGPVVGPIGASIKIVAGKEHLAEIAELAIGTGVLDRFIVTNDDDRRLLQQVRQQVACGPQECNIFQMHNGPRFNIHPPPEGTETVDTVLQVADDLVYNCLVDNSRIDQRALGTSKEASETALLIEQNGRLVIRGGVITEVFTLPDGDSWKVNNGSLGIVSNERRLKRSIGVDKTAAVTSAKEEMIVLQDEIKELKATQLRLEKEHTDYRKKWNEVKRERRGCLDEIEALEERREILKAEEENAANFAQDTSEFEEDVAAAELTLDRLVQNKCALQQEVDELVPSVEDVKKRLLEVTTRNNKVLADLQQVEDDLAQYLASLSQRSAHLEKRRAKIALMNQAIQDQMTAVAKKKATRDIALNRARTMHLSREFARRQKQASQDSQASTPEYIAPTEMDLEAVEIKTVPNSVDSYARKIERQKTKIAQEKERQQMTETTAEAALDKYTRASKSLDGKLKQIEAINVNIALLQDDMKSRKRRWKQFRKHIVRMTNESFDEFLQKKGSSGELEFSHPTKDGEEQGTLNLVVQKDNEDPTSQTKDVKALSGGERSFTTLALLLALGERLETPFRVMDEFDVFLDPVARKIALNSLVEVAKEMKHRQFIFITPQDLSALKPDALLKIFKMKPPVRNGLVGGPTQQTLD